METFFNITDHKIKYTSKSISGYKKSSLLDIFKKSLILNNYYSSLYFGFEIIISGYYNEFWRIVFTILVEYVHITSPNLPKNMYNIHKFYKKLQSKYKRNKIDIRNIFEFQKQIVFLIKNLTTISQQQKVHISHLIRPSYNNYETSKVRHISMIVPVLRRFKVLLQLCIYNKINNIQTPQKTLEELFNIIGYLLSVDSDSYHQDKPYRIKLYHHKNSKINQDIIGLLWNILLKSGKINKFILQQIMTFYNIYTQKILYKIEKDSYLILNAIFYLIYSYNDIQLTRILKQDISYIERIYYNIQVGINTNSKRIDYIPINNTESKKVPHKKVPQQNNILQNSILQKNNLQKKEIQQPQNIDIPSIFGDIIKNDMYYKSIYEDHMLGDSEIEITTNEDQDLEPDLQFYFNYDNLTEYKINEYNRDHLNELRNISLPKEKVLTKKDNMFVRKL
jgi:hypothetical protein